MWVLLRAVELPCAWRHVLSQPYRGATFTRPPELALILNVPRVFTQLSSFVSVVACDLLRPTLNTPVGGPLETKSNAIMSAEPYKKAEKSPSHASPDVATPGRRKNEHRTLWLSRASFLISALALVSVGYRAVAQRVLDSEPIARAIAAVSPPLPALAAHASPDNAGAPTPPVKVEVAGSESLALVPRVQANLKKGLAALRIKRLVVTQAVEDREPVTITDVVDSETPIIAFLEVASGAVDEQQVVVTFEHEEGHSVGLVNLSVPGNKPRWRTWGRTYNIKQDGRWTAVVRDSRGEELGRTKFTVRRES